MIAMRLRTACRQPGCPATVDKPGYCDKHRQNANQAYARQRPDQEEQAIYASGRWKKISARFKQDNPLCEICLKQGKITPSEITHHKKPLREGGDPWLLENMEAICKSCHAKIHN